MRTVIHATKGSACLGRQSDGRLPGGVRDGDEGAIMVMVALLMTMLLGVGALVIDLGALYVEKRELQNGADAGALAVAQSCAQGDCGPAVSMAEQYADLNARDGRSNVDAVCGDGPGLSPCADGVPSGAGAATGWVRVSTSTQDPDGGSEVDFLLAPIMGSVTGRTVHSSAVAAWGPLGGGQFVPFTISICEFSALGGSFDGLTFPSGTGYIYYHGQNTDDPRAGTCTPSPSGQVLPGGFGRVDSANCSATLATGQWAGNDTGNDLSKDCPYTTWQGQEIVIALYDQVRGTGNNGEYHIVGFVGLLLQGYRLGGNRTYASGACPLVANASVSYFCGTFTKVSANAGDFGPGGNYGASVIKMVG